MLKVIRKIMWGIIILTLLLVVQARLERRKMESLEQWNAVVIQGIGKGHFAGISIIPEVIEEREEVGLPDFYDYRQEGRAPQVKDQRDVNNCWAFAGTGALESSLLPEESQVFSAEHMTNRNSYTFDPEDGGAYVISVAYLTAWQGPVLEEADPSGDGVSPDGLSAEKQVLDVRSLDYKDYEAIKRTVYLYGGVESSIYMDFTKSSSTSSSYDESAFSYCYIGETEPNHDVLIIGWDDDYPAERFVTQPEGNGAFICQNSWGEKFGDNGVFYVSYYDSNIGGTNTAYVRVEDAGYFDDLYQSDLCGWTGQVGYSNEEAWFSNIYTAKEAEYLAAAGFYTTGSDSIYEVYLVPDFSTQEDLQNRKFLVNGYLQYAGYHTIEFPKEIPLEQGQQFALVVHLTTKDAIYPIAVEYAQEDDPLLASVRLDDGKGYISEKGTDWVSVEEGCESNLCLKSYIRR